MSLLWEVIPRPTTRAYAECKSQEDIWRDAYIHVFLYKCVYMYIHTNAQKYLYMHALGVELGRKIYIEGTHRGMLLIWPSVTGQINALAKILAIMMPNLYLIYT